MDTTPSSGSDVPSPLTRRTDPALADRSRLRSRRLQTFGLGALCGALSLSLVIVVASIFAAGGSAPPLRTDDPAPASEPFIPAPRPTVPTPAPTPTFGPQDETDAVTEPDTAPEQPVVQVPAPAPEPTEALPPAEEEDEPGTDPSDGRGNSASAPGHTKAPKNP